MASSRSGPPPKQREQTLLRVKRRRNENPPSTIRLELLGGWNVRRHDENESSQTGQSQGQSQQDNASASASMTRTDTTNTNTNTSMSTDTNANNNNNSRHKYPPFHSSSTATIADSQHSSVMSTSSTQTTNNVNNNINNNNTNAAPPPPRRTAAAVWKRVEVLEGESPSAAAYSSSFALDGEHKRCRVVDAVLEQDERSTKRRKLTVLGELNPGGNVDDLTNKPGSGGGRRKPKAYRVLDPVTRLVDDSLCQVQMGETSTTQHYSLITTDPRLATHARTWMVYGNRAGNLLHACAQWNDVELAHDLLRQSLPNLSDATDGEGRTPYETAQLSGHESICEVLEAFGADTTNYVYDIFVPEEIELEPMEATATEDGNNNSNTNNDMQATAEDDNWNPLEKTPIGGGSGGGGGDYPLAASAAVARAYNSAAGQNKSGPATAPDLSNIDTSRLLELQGGVGYWTEDGELILEVEAHHMLGMANEYDHDTEDEFGEDDDIDSNCEDYGGNDYPDEDFDSHWEEQFLRVEPVLGRDATVQDGSDDDDDNDDDSGRGYGEEDVW